jgi:type VI secretion system protein ImpC
MADAKSQEKQAQTETIESDDFASLLQQEFKPKSDRAKEEVESAVHTLAQQVLEGEALLADDVIGTINAIIAEIDAKLTEQINHIMHHEDFRKLEGAWRGLHHLVNNTETDEMLKIRVMNITKKELGKLPCRGLPLRSQSARR